MPIVPPFVYIPGKIAISIKSQLKISANLEKPINIGYFYSKHVKITIPFGWYKGKINNPNPSQLLNIYGSSDANTDFRQFLQIPQVDAILTLTPVVEVIWPEFGSKSALTIKSTPTWIHRHSIQKRGLWENLKKSFQVTLYSELPVLATGSLESCTQTCPAQKPIEAKLQVCLGNFKAGFTIFGKDVYFSIPIKLTFPPTSICLPFINICKGKCMNVRTSS